MNERGDFLEYNYAILDTEFRMGWKMEMLLWRGMG